MRLLHQQRFTQPEICEEALDEYRVESNPAREFLTANFHEDPLSDVETALVYKQYTDFCESNGYRQLGERTFGKEVRRVFKTVDRRNAGARGNRFYIYQGLREGEKENEETRNTRNT
jgi:phage/plasmid-associated DNA primase